MSAGVLEGTAVALLSDDPAAATCARHLERLGALLTGEAGADILLVDERSSWAAAACKPVLICLFETHALLGGGLAASEATVQATLGLTDYIGPAAGRPARTGCDVASSSAGVCATQAVLAWLCSPRSGTDTVRVSSLRSLSALKTILWAARARPDAWSGTHVRSRERRVDSGYRAGEGRLTLDFPVDGKAGWNSFVEELGLDAATIAGLEPRWYETVGWGDDVDDARPVYEARFRERSLDEVVALVRRHGGSSVPFLTIEECLEHPQSRALGLRDLPLSHAAALIAGGPPWSFGEAPAAPRAPFPGGDTDALRSEPESFWLRR